MTAVLAVILFGAGMALLPGIQREIREADRDDA